MSITHHKHRLATMIFLRIIPVAIFVLVLLWFGTRYFAYKTIEKDLYANLSAQTKQTAMLIERKLDNIKQYAQILASNDLVVNGLIDITARSNYIPTLFQSLIVPEINTAQVVLTDYKGRMIASNFPEQDNYETDPDISYSVIINKVMDGHTHFQIDPGLIIVAVPVNYFHLPEGAIFVYFRSQDLSTVFTKVSYPVDFILIKNERISLAITNEAMNFKVADNEGHFLEKAAASHDSHWIKQQLAIPSYTGLSVVCGLKKEEILQGYKRFEKLILLSMLLALFALTIGVFIASRLATNPLVVFAKGIENVRGTKCFNIRFPEGGAWEVSYLASAFNALFEELISITITKDQLEERVALRTKELEMMQGHLVKKAIEAGRVQLSNMVLHNIGNAVTPLNLQVEGIRENEIGRITSDLQRCYSDLCLNKVSLTDYVSRDKRGVQVFEYMSGLIDELIETSDGQENTVEKIKKTVANVNAMLTLQQMYSGTDPDYKEQTDINDLVTTAIQIQSPEFDKRKIKISEVLSDGMRPVNVNKNQLLQVLLNLLKHRYEAIGYIHKPMSQRKVAIQTYDRKQGIGFEIIDFGGGIDPDTAFHPVETDDSSNGTADLDLYYCKLFVQANDGEIFIDKMIDEKKTRISVWFNTGDSAME